MSVAEKFNSFYTNVASKLVEKLPFCQNVFGRNFVLNYYASKGVIPNNFALSIVYENTILKYLNKLSDNKATGLDGISSRFVRDSASIITCPLTHIVNLSIIQGSVPDDLKSARVIPLYKKNDKTEVGNYRPVSILSIISKIFERVVYDQVVGYLDDKKLLYSFQSGFRRGFSTETCLIHLSDFIRFNMDKGNLVGMVLLDLQKAFDTVDHGILLMKLEAIGLHGDAIRWFRSYLSDRNQLVDVSGIFSTEAPITCGVPQGSILGPLLFLIYVNDMSAAVNDKVLLYADDSCILVTGKSRSDIEEQLSKDLEVIGTWLVNNKLSLHLGKTESILFGSKPKIRNGSTLNISCNGATISATSSVKYLGATLDQNLSGETIAMAVIGKANSRLKFLYRKSKFLTMHTRKLLVSSLIQCHFDYSCSFWYPGLTQFLKSRLQSTQNKLVRFVLGLDNRSHVGEEQFVYLNWLPVSKRVDQIMLGHVHKIRYGLAPDYMGEHFIPLKTVHSRNTRSNVFVTNNCPSVVNDFQFNDTGIFAKPRVKGFGEKSFVSRGVLLWNDLPQSLRDIPKSSNFKTSVKKHMLTF